MSDDMLKATLDGLHKDLANKLSGNQSTSWVNALKRFLRKENPWPVSESPPKQSLFPRNTVDWDVEWDLLPENLLGDWVQVTLENPGDLEVGMVSVVRLNGSIVPVHLGNSNLFFSVRAQDAGWQMKLNFFFEGIEYDCLMHNRFHETDIAERSVVTEKLVTQLYYPNSSDVKTGSLIEIAAGRTPLESVLQMEEFCMEVRRQLFCQALGRLTTFLILKFTEKANGSFECCVSLGSWRSVAEVPRELVARFADL